MTSQDHQTNFPHYEKKEENLQALRHRIYELEETVRQHEREIDKFRSTLDMLPNYIFSCKKNDFDKMFFELGQGASSQKMPLFKENVSGANIEDLFLPKYASIFSTAFERAFAGETIEFLTEHMGRVFNYTVKPFYDESKQITEIVGFASEITDQKRTEDVLHEVLQGVTGKTGDEFFQYLVCYLTTILHVKYAFIGLLDQNQKNKMYIYAISKDGILLENQTYFIENTPSEKVMQSMLCSYPDRVSQHFPLDDWVQEHRIESYIGTPLFDRRANRMGVVAIMDSQPMRDPRIAETILTIFASHIAAEMERKLSEAELLKSNAILQAAQESTPNGMIILNENFEMIGHNQKFLEIFSVPKDLIENDDMIPLMSVILKKVVEADRLNQKIQFLCEYPHESYQTELTLKDGRILDSHIVPILSPEGQNFGRIWHLIDITQYKKFEEQMALQSYYDPLTGLANRVLFNDRLDLALSQANRSNKMLGVIFIDLDRFKYINDMYTHAVGDTLLQQVANRLKTCIRKGDTLSRLGSDEFQMILPDINYAEDVAKIAQSILDQFTTPFILEGTEFFPTCSIGISIYPSDSTDNNELIKNAIAATYRAKEKGGNNYQLYTPSLNTTTFQKLELEKELRKAIEREELIVHYQPRVDLHTGKMIGMEALVRWQHPTLGRIPPIEFISLAEETGLIIPLDEYVLRMACIQAKQWQEAGYPTLRLAVNLSAVQFHKQDMVENIEKILQETGLDPQYLEVEITEGVTMHKVDTAIHTLHQLKQLGVHIAIDDFGTGYSSLSYLKKFPIDTLKIDRSFVQDVTNDPDDAGIVSYIITLAHSLKLNVIAEGVETNGQREFLYECGCDEMQGFLYSPPVSKEEFEDLLKRG